MSQTLEWTPQALDVAAHIERGYVRVRDVLIDPSYQRDINPAKVAAIVKNFNPRRLGPIDVSRRDDGHDYAFDGQHRLEVARRLGQEVVPANIHFGLTVEEEAALFDEQTDNTTPLDIWAHHKARLRYGHGAAHAIETTSTRYGYRLTAGNKESPRTIAALGSLYAIHGWAGTSLLSAVFDVIGSVWRTDTKAVDGLVLKGIATFLLSWPNHDPNRLRDVLARHPAIQVASDAMKMKINTGSGSVSPSLIATAIRDIYNKGLGPDRKLSGGPRSPRVNREIGYLRRQRR